jgi:hypothetical protein
VKGMEKIKFLVIRRTSKQDKEKQISHTYINTNHIVSIQEFGANKTLVTTLDGEEFYMEENVDFVLTSLEVGNSYLIKII